MKQKIATAVCIILAIAMPAIWSCALLAKKSNQPEKPNQPHFDVLTDGTNFYVMDNQISWLSLPLSTCAHAISLKRAIEADDPEITAAQEAARYESSKHWQHSDCDK